MKLAMNFKSLILCLEFYSLLCAGKELEDYFDYGEALNSTAIKSLYDNGISLDRNSNVLTGEDNSIDNDTVDDVAWNKRQHRSAPPRPATYGQPPTVHIQPPVLYRMPPPSPPPPNPPPVHNPQQPRHGPFIAPSQLPSPYSPPSPYPPPLPSQYHPPSIPLTSIPSPRPDLCPPAATSCPHCISSVYELPKHICRYPVVLKVLLLGAPVMDSYGRVCGKFGVYDAIGPLNVALFRRLLRFSINDDCLYQHNYYFLPNRQYILITDLTGFVKEGNLYTKVALSHQAVLLSLDRYTQAEVFAEIQKCSPPVPPIHDHPPTPLPVLSNCLITDRRVDKCTVLNDGDLYCPVLYNRDVLTCPVVTDITKVDLATAYCASDFALLAVIPAVKIPSVDSDYRLISCLNHPSKILFDVSKGRDPKALNLNIGLLLPDKCPRLPPGPLVLLVLGSGILPPAPPVAQLTNAFTLVALPAHSTLTIPSCFNDMRYALFSEPPPPPAYMMITPKKNTATEGNTCPVCTLGLDSTLTQALCSAKFAAAVSLAAKGPVGYAPPAIIPDIKVTAKMGYDKQIIVDTKALSLPTGDKGMLNVEHFFVPQAHLHEATLKIPIDILATCNCSLLQKPPGTKLLIFSPLPPPPPSETVQLTKDIFVTPLPGSFPSCLAQYAQPMPTLASNAPPPITPPIYPRPPPQTTIHPRPPPPPPAIYPAPPPSYKPPSLVRT